MIFVITGNGKGKTTSAVGMVCRANGHGKKCCIIQFIKKNPEQYGEFKTMTSIGVKWESFGEGFTWLQEDLEETAELCRKGWESFKKKVENNAFDFIVLDEFTYVLENNFLQENEVLAFLKKIKNSNINVVITGRRASAYLTDLADTVSEIEEIKHHYNSNGHKTILGIEY